MKPRIGLAIALFFTAHAYAQTIEETWQHHIEAWGRRDLDAIAQDYTEDATLILNNTIFKGTEAIKKAFSQLFRIFDGGQNQIEEPTIDGKIIYITWNFTPRGKGPFFGTDTFVIENGKIAYQTIASTLYEVFPLTR